MAWVRLDDHFPEHPKWMSMSPLFRVLSTHLHVAALCWCNRQLTDGMIPRSAVAKLIPEVSAIAELVNEAVLAEHVADELVEAGVWEVDGLNYRIHDYLQYQPSRESVLTLRETRKQLGSKGGSQRQANAKQTSSKAEANVQANKQQPSGNGSSQIQPRSRSQVPNPRSDLANARSEGRARADRTSDREIRTDPTRDDSAATDAATILDLWRQVAESHGMRERVIAGPATFGHAIALASSFSLADLEPAMHAMFTSGEFPPMKRSFAMFASVAAQIIASLKEPSPGDDLAAKMLAEIQRAEAAQ